MVHLPAIKFCNSPCTLGMENPDEVGQNGLPNTQFKFMHEIHNKKGEKYSTQTEKELKQMHFIV